MIPRLGDGNMRQRARDEGALRLENDSPSRGRKQYLLSWNPFEERFISLENDSPSRGRKPVEID